jgi:phage shock protein C
MDAVKTEQRPSNVGPAASPTVPAKRLYRSRDNRVLKGVAGGIGEFYGVDPVIVRLLLLLTFPFGGIGIIGYILGAILIPARPKGESAPATPTVSGLQVLHDRSLGVWVLVAIGAAMVLDQLNLNIVGDRLWPLLLIGGGLIVLMRRRDATAVEKATTAARAATAYETSPLFEYGPSRRDLHAEALAELHDPVVDDLDRAVAELQAERLGGAPSEPVVVAPVVNRRQRRRPRSVLRRLVYSLVGLTLLLFIISAAIGVRILSRGAGQQAWTPTPEMTSFNYSFGAGDTTLDLRELAKSMATKGDAKTVKGKVQLDFGRLNVIVPTDPSCPSVKLNTKARIALGYSGDGESTGVVGGSRQSKFGASKNVIDITATLAAGNLNIIKNSTPCLAPAATPSTISTSSNQSR